MPKSTIGHRNIFFSLCTPGVYKIALFVYLILKPLYLFKSGTPQIADLVFLVFSIPFMYSLNWKELLSKKAIISLMFFFIIVCLVNTMYFFYDSSGLLSYDYLLSIAYLGFNILLFVFVFKTITTFGEKDYKLFFASIFISLLFLFLLLLFDYDKGITNNFKGRSYLTFNNPNQLSYFCLIAGTIVLLILPRLGTIKKYVPFVLSLILILTVNATSRPAIVGASVFVFYYFIFYFKKISLIGLLLFIVPILTVIVFQNKKIGYDISHLTSRFKKIDTKGDIADRGFIRVFKYPEYLIYGAGEGNYSRFTTEEHPNVKEIHSSFISLIFNYGIVGFLSFLAFLILIFKKIKLKFFLLFMPLILYNLFHNGIRFSLLWVLFALVFVLYQKD